MLLQINLKAIIETDVKLEEQDLNNFSHKGKRLGHLCEKLVKWLQKEAQLHLLVSQELLARGLCSRPETLST